MSKPILHTEVLRSMTKVTTMACRVPTKQMRVVSDSGASYLLSVAACVQQFNLKKKVNYLEPKKLQGFWR